MTRAETVKEDSNLFNDSDDSSKADNQAHPETPAEIKKRGRKLVDSQRKKPKGSILVNSFPLSPKGGQVNVMSTASLDEKIVLEECQ